MVAQAFASCVTACSVLLDLVSERVQDPITIGRARSEVSGAHAEAPAATASVAASSAASPTPTAGDQALVTMKLAKTTFCPAEAVRPMAPLLLKVSLSACLTSMPLTKKFMWAPLIYTVRRLWSPLFC
jgi:hypothetical protein